MNLLGLDLGAWLVPVIGAVMLAGFLRGFVGFGAALVVVPVLSLVLGPQLAVAATNIMGTPAMLQLLPEAIRRGERAIVLPMALMVFLAAPFGTWLLVFANPAVMKIVISLLVLAMVAFLATGWKLPGEPRLAHLLGAGMAGGLVQGAAGIGGPPVVAVALSRPGPPVQQRGNVLALMTAVSLSSIVPLIAYGLITRQALVMGALLMPVYSAATWVGSRYFHLGGQTHYRRAAIGMLALIGVATLAGSVWSYAHQ